jgi:hypothetical protein
MSLEPFPAPSAAAARNVDLAHNTSPDPFRRSTLIHNPHELMPEDPFELLISI